jgi:hypothetical protein
MRARQNIFRTIVWAIVFGLGLCLMVGAIAAVSGCSRSTPAPSATATVLTVEDVRAELPAAIMGDVAYAQVNSAWLKEFYADFRAEIFRQGVTKWDERFDCNHFAAYYVALAQTRFYLATFHSRTKAQSLAVATYWYTRPTGRHAIVIALTERGPVFIEPQTGAEVRLTPAEKSTAFPIIF